MKNIILLMSLLCMGMAANAQNQSYRAVLLEEYYKGRYEAKLEMSYDTEGRVEEAHYSLVSGNYDIYLQFTYSDDHINIHSKSSFATNSPENSTVFLTDGTVTRWEIPRNSDTYDATAEYSGNALARIEERYGKDPREYLFTWENGNIKEMVEKEMVNNGYQVTKVFTMSEHDNPSSNPIPIELTELGLDAFQTPSYEPYSYFSHLFGQRPRKLIQSYTDQQKQGSRTWDPHLWEFSYEFDSNGNITDFYSKKDDKDREHIHVTYAQISTSVEAVSSCSSAPSSDTYNLCGQRVKAKAMGMNIVRGTDGTYRKVIIR